MQTSARALLISDEQALGCCLLARQHEERGDYETAAMALKQWWEVGEKSHKSTPLIYTPKLTCYASGTVYGWLGSVQTDCRSAKGRARVIAVVDDTFQADQRRDACGGSADRMAYCYWREGAFDLARTNLPQP